MSVRPFTPADRDAVNALHREVWWPERSDAGWAWLDANPARHDIDAPAGWVAVDASDRPVAFVGNLVQRFWHGEDRLHGGTGFSIIVPHAARGRSRNLIQAVMRQPDVFATYTFNANPMAARLYPRQGLAAWPPRTHGLKLSWIVDPLECLQGRLLRTLVHRAPRLTDPYREHFMNRRLKRRTPAAAPIASSPAAVAVLDDLSDGSDYAAFWQALRAEGRLIADRSPEILRWRLNDPDRTDPPILLAFRRNGAITGYAMALLAKGNPIEPAALEIIDLIALQDEPHAIPALMQALMQTAKTLGAAKLRLQAMGEDLLRRLGPWAARAHREGGWGHCHAAFRPDAPSSLTWQPTPFDGDYGVCQRPIPLAREAQPARVRQTDAGLSPGR